MAAAPHHTLMSNYSALKTRILQILEDPQAVRYTDSMIQEAMRQALNACNTFFPQLKSSTLTVSTPGRIQSLSTLTGFMRLHYLIYPYSITQLELPSISLTYYIYFESGFPNLYFLGSTLLQTGQQIKVFYFASHTIESLDAALSTTLPAQHETLFVQGVAGFACQMRIHSLLEAYGDRSADIPRLQELSLSWLDKFNTYLARNQTVTLSSAFPDGFKLDQWDK